MSAVFRISSENIEKIRKSKGESKDYVVDVDKFLETLDKIKKEYDIDEPMDRREELILDFCIQTGNMVVAMLGGKAL